MNNQRKPLTEGNMKGAVKGVIKQTGKRPISAPPPPRSSPLKLLKELVEFIEENDVTDEAGDDGGGHTDEWRSYEFNALIKRAKETLKNLERT